MLAVLAGSCLVDPVVLYFILYVAAKSQVDTRYSMLFAINIVIGVATMVSAFFILPTEDPIPPVVAGAVIYMCSVLMITKSCCLSLTRGTVVTTLFIAYKILFVYIFLYILWIFGFEVELTQFQIDVLNDTETPLFLQWLWEHGLWFRSI